MSLPGLSSAIGMAGMPARSARKSRALWRAGLPSANSVTPRPVDFWREFAGYPAAGDQHFRVAVRKDEGNFRGDQPGGNADIIESGALRRPDDLEEFGPTFSSSSAMTSPRRNPSWRNSCAPWFERASSWA